MEGQKKLVFKRRNSYIIEAMQYCYSAAPVLNIGNNEYGFFRWIFIKDLLQVTGLTPAILKHTVYSLEKKGAIERRIFGGGIQQYSLLKYTEFILVNDYFQFNDKNNAKSWPESLPIQRQWNIHNSEKRKEGRSKHVMQMRERTEVQEMLHEE